jgi:hypothetical protein
MDPLVSLHYYAPVCSLINACFIPFTEGLAPFREFLRVGPFIMLTNALTAFGLNVAAVFLIGAAGGLVLTVAGVFKVCWIGRPADGRALSRSSNRLPNGEWRVREVRRTLIIKDILLISSSCLFFGSRITAIQIFGTSTYSSCGGHVEVPSCDASSDGSGYSLALGGLFAYKNASK